MVSKNLFIELRQKEGQGSRLRLAEIRSL